MTKVRLLSEDGYLEINTLIKYCESRVLELTTNFAEADKYDRGLSSAYSIVGNELKRIIDKEID